MILDVVGSNPITHPIQPALALRAPLFPAAMLELCVPGPIIIVGRHSAKVAELVDAPDLGSGIFTM